MEKEIKRIHVEKDFQSSGLDCRVVMTIGGHRCGYVRVPEDCDLFEKNIVFSSEVRLDVHGGVTFSGKLRGVDGWWIGFDCAHLGDGKDWDSMYKYFDNEHVKKLFEIELKFPSELGSDWAKNEDYVVGECEVLAKQITEHIENVERYNKQLLDSTTD